MRVANLPCHARHRRPSSALRRPHRTIHANLGPPSCLVLLLAAAANAKTALVIIDTQLCFTNEIDATLDLRWTQPAEMAARSTLRLKPWFSLLACLANPVIAMPRAWTASTGGTDTCSRSGCSRRCYGRGHRAGHQPAAPDKSCMWTLIIRTQDYHPPGHISFGIHPLRAGSCVPEQRLLTFAGGPLPFVGVTASTCTAPTLPLAWRLRAVLPRRHGAAGMHQPRRHWERRRGQSVMSRAPTRPTRRARDARYGPGVVLPDAAGHVDRSALASRAATRLRVWPRRRPDTDLVIQKGNNPHMDAYTAFMDNAKLHHTTLHDTLTANGITELYITGIATTDLKASRGRRPTASTSATPSR